MHVCVMCCGLQSDLHQGIIWEGTSETADPYWAALERKHSRHEGVAFGWSPTAGEHPTRSQHGHVCVCVCVSDIMDSVMKRLLVQYRERSEHLQHSRANKRKGHTHTQKTDKNEMHRSKLRPGCVSLIYMTYLWKVLLFTLDVSVKYHSSPCLTLVSWQIRTHFETFLRPPEDAHVRILPFFSGDTFEIMRFEILGSWPNTSIVWETVEIIRGNIKSMKNNWQISFGNISFTKYTLW